jgi:hypothetical protein
MPQHEVIGPCWKAQDFTSFFNSDDIVHRLLEQPLPRHFLDDRFTFKGHDLSGRGLLCWCCGREALSLTMRTSSAPVDLSDYCIEWKSKRSTWSARQGSERLSNLLYRLTLEHRDTPRGVIALFGETGSRKSSLALALVDIYLQNCVKSASEIKKGDNKSEARRPHLLTFEDPIEELFGPLSDHVVPTAAERLRQAAQDLGVDYTPRQIGVDSLNLQEGLRNAKRQKPSVVYVGEVRTEEEWRDVLDFAGSGHLVVTTSHGGSLLESMSTVLKAAKAHTPAQRSFVAGRVLAIIHVRRYRHKGLSEIIPALWRRTPAGANTLVTDGLGSIIPHNPPSIMESPGNTTAPPEESSLGRHWFVTQLCSLKTQPNFEPFYQRSLLDDVQGL